MELERSNQTRGYSYKHELRHLAEIVSLWCGWKGQWPQLKFSKLLELSGTNRARKLMYGLQVNMDKGNSRRWCYLVDGIQWAQ